MGNLSFLPPVRGIRVEVLRGLEDLPSSVKGERLTDLLQSEPVRGGWLLEFCTHGRCSDPGRHSRDGLITHLRHQRIR